VAPFLKDEDDGSLVDELRKQKGFETITYSSICTMLKANLNLAAANVVYSGDDAGIQRKVVSTVERYKPSNIT
jgi:hypothetical protein